MKFFNEIRYEKKRTKRIFLITFSLLILTSLLQNMNCTKLSSQDIDLDDDDLFNSLATGGIKKQKKEEMSITDENNNNNNEEKASDDLEINLLELKSKNKNNNTSNLRKASSNMTTNTNTSTSTANKTNSSNNTANQDASGDDEMNSKKPKFIPYNQVNNNLFKSSNYKEKMDSFKQNIMSSLQTTKTFKASPIEGYMTKFQKRKFVKPGQDLFLGFLKYMSNTADNIMQKKINDKRRQLY